MKLKYLLIPLGIIYSISGIAIWFNPFADWSAKILLYLYLPMIFAVWYLIIKCFARENPQNNFIRTVVLVITALYSLFGIICLASYISNKFYNFNLEEEFVIFKFGLPFMLVSGYLHFPIYLSLSFWYLLLKENQ